MTERIRLLIRAAREVRSPALRDELLDAAEEESQRRPSRVRTAPQLDSPSDINFPLTIFLNTPKRGDVEAQLQQDATVLLDGAVFANPSSSELMEMLGFRPGNAWPRWRFKAPDGRILPIQALRECDPPLVRPSRKRRGQPA